MTQEQAEIKVKEIHDILYFLDNERRIMYDTTHPGEKCNIKITWDILIEFVEKVEKMDFGFKMCRKVVEIYRDSTKKVYVKIKKENRYESLYKAIIEFLRLWNFGSSYEIFKNDI